MVKHSKKLGKKGNVNRKNQSRKHVKRSGKQVSKLGRQGRSGRRAGMRSVKSVIGKKKKQKMQRGKGGDDEDGSIGKIYAFYDYNSNDNTNDFLLSFVELPLAENEVDPAKISGEVLYRAFADNKLHGIIDKAATAGKTDDKPIELDPITLPNDFDFLKLVSDEQDRIIDILDENKDKGFNGGSYYIGSPSSQSGILYTSAKRRRGFTEVKTHNQALMKINISQDVYDHFKKQLHLTNEWIKTQKLIDKIRINPGGKVKQLRAIFFNDNTMKLSSKQEADIEGLRDKLNYLKEEIKIGLPKSLKYIKANRIQGDGKKICYPDNSQEAKIDGRVSMASVLDDSLWNIMLSFCATLENRLKELEDGEVLYSDTLPPPPLPPGAEQPSLPPPPLDTDRRSWTPNLPRVEH